MKGAFDLYHEPLGHHGLSSPLWPLGTHGPSWTQWVFLFPLSSSIRPSHVIPGRLLLSGPTREYGPIVELRFLEFLQICPFRVISFASWDPKSKMRTRREAILSDFDFWQYSQRTVKISGDFLIGFVYTLQRFFVFFQIRPFCLRFVIFE